MSERDGRRPAATACGAAGMFVPAEAAGELAGALALYRDLLLGKRPPAEVHLPRYTRVLVDLEAVAADVAREHQAAKHRATAQARTAARIFAAEDLPPVALSAPAQITGPSGSASITVQQAADMLDLTVQHVRYLASCGRITGHRSERKVWALSRESVVAYRDRRRLRRAHVEGRNDRARGAAQP